MYASPAWCLDGNYYAWNGFSPACDAFTQLAFIFSDDNYYLIVFAVMLMSICACIARGLAVSGGAKSSLWSWVAPLLIGLVILQFSIVPKGNIYVYDPVRKSAATIPGVPDGLVLLADGFNDAERTLVDIVTDGTSGIAQQTATVREYNSGSAFDQVMPAMRAAVMAVMISMIPILVIFIITTFAGGVFMLIGGFLALNSAWGAVDAIVHNLDMNELSRMMHEAAIYNAGYASISGFIAAVSKEDAMFQVIRWASFFLATGIVFLCGCLGISVFRQFALSLHSAIAADAAVAGTPIVTGEAEVQRDAEEAKSEEADLSSIDTGGEYADLLSETGNQTHTAAADAATYHEACTVQSRIEVCVSEDEPGEGGQPEPALSTPIIQEPVEDTLSAQDADTVKMSDIDRSFPAEEDAEGDREVSNAPEPEEAHIPPVPVDILIKEIIATEMDPYDCVSIRMGLRKRKVTGPLGKVISGKSIMERKYYYWLKAGTL